jgi:hypothetical protein
MRETHLPVRILCGGIGSAILFLAVATGQAAEPRVTRLPPVAVDASAASGAAVVGDAAEVLGAWRGSRGQLALYDNGRIVLWSATPANGTQHAPSAPVALEGRFSAEGDVLYISWRDGSRSNLRWKLRDENLLLSDHRGQLSLLQRLPLALATGAHRTQAKNLAR